MRTTQPTMDNKSANGLQTKVSEGEVQRKQLPYSVETPYGFHLDLDFLKYVDDIEKGNTIKRVHIQRRLKGPPKFSTLPRNFSLPAHGARPLLKEKEIAWSGVSTLGPKPKSRLTEVQQVLDFRAGDGGFSSRSTTAQGYVSLKPKEEAGAGTREEKGVGLQGRPNLLRASSMPITLQQRKGSDSSSPDRIIGTPENGSTENMFRASPDLTERRVPQDRIGIHQQITVALKRVRELEEQVKTIPELKAQIASLRSEREQLLRQLQAQAQALVSATSPSTTTGSEAEQPTKSPRSKQGFNLPLVTTSGVDVEVSEPVKQVKDVKEKNRNIKVEMDSSQETSEDTSTSSSQALLDTDAQEVKSLRRTGDTVSNKEAIKTNKGTHDPKIVHSLNEQLKTLEVKLSQASQELQRANHLLKEQMAENKLKEEKLQQLSEGHVMEVCRVAPRRESIDAGTVTEKVDFAHRETETEPCGTVDQGTDTERICIEVHVPQPGPMDQEVEGSPLNTVDQRSDMEMDDSSAPRPRANSMERGTVTERVDTQDQMTETPVTQRVNQVTETEEETVNNHPHRPRASSVDRGTETERVHTVDRVTETEVAHRSNQQTETEVVPHNNNPATEPMNQDVTENTSNESASVDVVVGGEVDSTPLELEALSNVGTESLINNTIKICEASEVSDTEKVEEGQQSTDVVQNEALVDPKTAQNDSNTKENIPPDSTQTETVGKKMLDSEIVRATIKETVVTDTVVIMAETPAAKTVVPVRPQRGRRPSGEQAPSTLPQPAPVRPRRGSSESQGQQPKPETNVQVQEKKDQSEPLQMKIESPTKTEQDKLPQKSTEKQPHPGGETKREIQTLPKTVQAQPTTRRNSKELKALQKGSSVSLPSSRASGGSRPTRQGSSEVQPQARRKSTESTSEAQPLRRGSSEASQRRGSGESQASRRGSGIESPTSPAALGQVVTRLTGLLGEQWAQLGSSSGAQQSSSQQETPGTQKQTAGKRAEASKGASAKPAGKAAPAASGKTAGKPAPSKMSSIQSQLVSSLSVLSAFYSPAQKAAAAKKQQEQGLKSIMKKNASTDKEGNKGAKKNLKFVGVNGGRYETTSSEESSGDEKTKAEAEDEGDSSEPEVEKESQVKPGEETQKKEEGAEGGSAAAVEEESERGRLERESRLLEELAEGNVDRTDVHLRGDSGKVDKGFIDACLYVKDRMEEVSSPDKEMRQVLVVLYQEWFKVSSQKDSQADTVRLYLRQVGLTTPTLLPYVVNLTDGNGNMALHYSVSHSNFPVVKLLLDTGLCEADNVNKAGYTPVMLAALTPADSPDDLEVVQQLLRQGDVNARSRQMSQTALMLAVSHGRLAMAKLLLSCGADVNAQDREGSTALMCASEHGHTHIAGLLLETGRCDLSLSDKNGQTAQAIAEESSHQEVIDLLKSNAKTRTS